MKKKAKVVKKKVSRRKKLISIYLHHRDYEPIDQLIADVQTASGWEDYGRSQLIVSLLRMVNEANEKGWIDPRAIRDPVSEREVWLAAFGKFRK